MHTLTVHNTRHVYKTKYRSNLSTQVATSLNSQRLKPDCCLHVEMNWITFQMGIFAVMALGEHMYPICDKAQIRDTFSYIHGLDVCTLLNL